MLVYGVTEGDYIQMTEPTASWPRYETARRAVVSRADSLHARHNRRKHPPPDTFTRNPTIDCGREPRARDGWCVPRDACGGPAAPASTLLRTLAAVAAMACDTYANPDSSEPCRSTVAVARQSWSPGRGAN